MKKLVIHLAIILIVVISIVVLMISKEYLKKHNNSLIYEFKQSYHNEFYIDNGYVVFEDSIKVKNVTSKKIVFYMTADVSEDDGLVAENYAVACKKESLEKEKFSINANSEQTYAVYFKAKQGKKDTKLNRLPPKYIKFDIIE